VGQQGTRAAIDGQLSTHYRALRDLCFQISQLQTYVVWLGLTGLEGLDPGGAPQGAYSPADAQKVLDDTSYLNTSAVVFFGTGSQASPYNFCNQLAHLSAGS
jgi:hypothetical protein